MRIVDLTELEKYTEELNKKYNVNASITEQGEHLAVYPPYGGMWLTAWFLHINGKEIFVGNDYNNISTEKLKSIIEAIIKEEAL